MKFNKIYLCCVAILCSLFACEEDASYDMSYPIPVISSVSSLEATLGTNIVLEGDFKEVNAVYFGTEKAEFTPNENFSALTVTVPRKTDPEGATIAVSNDYSMSFSYGELFVPTIPSTSISKVGDIQSELSVLVEGENVDLITSLRINGNEAAFLSAEPNMIVASVAGMGLLPGGLATVEATSLALDNIAPIKNVDIVYPFVVYSEVSIFDFQKGEHAYTGEGKSSIIEGDVNGTTQKYFELRAPGYGWDKSTGEMVSTEVPDVSTMVTPYLTFCVRTPEGSGGYFQLDDQTGMWRHFNYGFRTDGEWMIISQPLNANWEGGEVFNPKSFKPRLTFKAGNAGEHQDLDIAYMKITEGPFDGSQKVGDQMGGSDIPSVIKIMDFENAADYPDVFNGDNLLMSIDSRSDVPAFVGNGAMGIVGDGSLTGEWGAYWGLPLNADLTEVDLTGFSDPYVSFAVNTNDKQQNVMMKIYQYDGQLQMAAKFQPLSDGKWSTYQFSLFNADLENWSPAVDGENLTPTESHFKSFKHLNPDSPIEKIEIIIGQYKGNTIELSLDEVVITEGPRF